MAVNVEKVLCGKANSKEDLAANKLVEYLKEYFEGTQVTGTIFVFVSVSIYKYWRNDIDILVLGKLKNFELDMKSEYRTANCREPFPAKFIKVGIEDFCIILEHKQHTFGLDPRTGEPKLKINPLEGVVVHYITTGETENATSQVKTQADGLRRMFQNEMNGRTPFVVPTVWLENLAEKPSNLGEEVPNVVYGNFSVRELFEAACSYNAQWTPYFNGKKYILSNRIDDVDPMKLIIEKISEKPKVISNITRKRLEMVTSDLLEVKLADLHYDKGLLVWEGRAGTGKTSALLRIAHLLKEEKHARCMILTYNRALVGDMRRTFAFLGMSYRPDGETIDVSTMQSFFIEIMDACGIEKPKFGKSYQKKYLEGMNQLRKHIEADLLDAKEISEIKRSKYHLSWDYVLVDEAQDWSDDEKIVLMHFFADGHLVVADGVDQIVVPGGKHQNWLLKKQPDEYERRKYEVGLRQLSVLTDFNLQFARIRECEWKVKRNRQKDSVGGRIVIMQTDSFVESLPRQLMSLWSDCESAKNEPYDMMMLVPHQHTVADPITGVKNLSESLRAKISAAGLELFDGVNDNDRSDYPIHEMRVFQYESCRGLEAWTTICLDFDVFLKNKADQYVMPKDLKVKASLAELVNEYVSSWAMMPLTRPIHTLVITVSDIHSEIAQQLRTASANLGTLECMI